MSQENLETLQRAQAAWNAEDLDAWLAELDPKAEWHGSLEQALQGRGNTYRGHDGLREAPFGRISQRGMGRSDESDSGDT